MRKSHSGRSKDGGLEDGAHGHVERGSRQKAESSRHVRTPCLAAY